MTNTLTTVATPPYWCTSMVNKLVASFAWNMVLCMIVGCGSKSGRDKGLYFARVPSTPGQLLAFFSHANVAKNGVLAVVIFGQPGN